MKSKMLCACAAIATLVFAAGDLYAVAENGAPGPVLDDPPITVDAGWPFSAASPPLFSWVGGIGDITFNNEGPFTWDSASPTLLFITDSFCAGDQFRIYDFGVTIGDTSVPTVTGCVSESNVPQDAFDDPQRSSGTFLLGLGTHSITIETIVNPFGSGVGFLKVDSAPEPLALTDALIDTVIDLDLKHGIENQLLKDLNAALGEFDDDVDDVDDVVERLDDFIATVEKNRGKKIPEADADELIAAAEEIIVLLLL